jgi:YD repeat-containing protein
MVPERARTKYTYDGLGRELTVVHAWSLPSASSQTLSSSLYDNAATLNANCPQPSNNLGRLLNRTDTFGKTWYRFSPEGRLTGEIRLRSGTTCASQLPRNVPHTFYTYSANGNLTSIQYPYGRTVTYVIGTPLCQGSCRLA